MIPASGLAAWIERLERAGLDLDVPVLLDALWLAGKRVAFESHAPPAPIVETPPRRRRKSSPTETSRPTSRVPEDGRAASAGTAKIYPHAASVPQGPSVRASPVAVPSAPALHQTLTLARALRPLRQKRRSPSRQELDEEATVHATAEQLRGVKPVFVPVREPWYEAAVVVEDDPAMHVWHDTVRAFVNLLERTGAFRDVRRWRLQMTPVRLVGPSGIPARSSCFESTYPKRLILFVTHGVSPHWFDGRYAQVIEPWCRYSSVLLVHLLPPHLWKLTELGEPRALVQTVQPGQITAGLSSAPLWWLRGLPPEGHRLSLPVASLDAASLGTWAQMQMARGSRSPAMIVDTRVRAQQGPEPAETESLDYEQAVAFFRSYATDAAWDLSIALSTSAFTLPVARVIQAARRGAAASHTHLAEVLLSGLVRTRTPINESTDPNEVYYEFYPEARSILQRSLRDDDREALARDLEEYVSRYLERQRGAPTNFRALVRDEKGNFDLPGWAQPFAHLGTALLGTAEGPSAVQLVERFRTAVSSKIFNAVVQLASVAFDPTANIDLRPWMADRVAALAKLDVDLWQTLLDHRLLAVREDGWWEFAGEAGERLSDARTWTERDQFTLDVNAGPAPGFKRRLVVASDERERSGRARHSGSFRVLQIRNEAGGVSVAQQRREAIASADIVVAWESNQRNWPELALAEQFGRTVYLSSNLADPELTEELLHLTLARPVARMSGVPLPEHGAPHPRAVSLAKALASSSRSTIILSAGYEARSLAVESLWNRRVRERYREITWRTSGGTPSYSAKTLTVMVGRDEPLDKWPTRNVLFVNPDLDVYGAAPVGVRWVDRRHIRRPKGVSPGEYDVRRLRQHVRLLPPKVRDVIGILFVLEGKAPARVMHTIPGQLIRDFLEAGVVRPNPPGFFVRACLLELFSQSAMIDSHRHVLRAYRFGGASDWRALEDDGYIHDNLFRHLIGAGMEAWATSVARREEWWELRARAGRVEDDLAALGRIGESIEVRRAVQAAERDDNLTMPIQEPVPEPAPPPSGPTRKAPGADVFLTFSSRDRAQATALVEVLQAMGWTVFWDQLISTGLPIDQAIESELDAAKCVIVLWSHSSVASRFVLYEAHRAMERGTLLPVRIDGVRPPLEFMKFNTLDFEGWTGARDDRRVDTLARWVTERVSPVDIRQAVLWPVDLHLVTGAMDRYPHLGPTVNMMCRLTNNETFWVELSELRLEATRNGEPVFDLVRHLFYDAHGGEHTQAGRGLPVTIGPASSWESGVQFRDERTDTPNVWPAGQYEFELRGLVRPVSTGVNVLGTTTLRTTFRAIVTQSVESQLTRWRNASKSEWDQSYASDRARGFTLNLTDIEAGTGRSPTV